MTDHHPPVPGGQQWAHLQPADPSAPPAFPPVLHGDPLSSSPPAYPPVSLADSAPPAFSPVLHGDPLSSSPSAYPPVSPPYPPVPLAHSSALHGDPLSSPSPAYPPVSPPYPPVPLADSLAPPAYLSALPGYPPGHPAPGCPASGYAPGHPAPGCPLPGRTPGHPTPGYPPPGYPPGHPPPGHLPPGHPPAGYAQHQSGPADPHPLDSPPGAKKAPGLLLIVLATLVSGPLGLHLTASRAAAARRLGLSTRRYWLAWAIPFAAWLPAIVYLNFFDRAGAGCICVR